MSEPYVSPEVTAEYLGVSKRHLLDLARAGKVRGYPTSLGRARYQWKFRISEIDADMELMRDSFTSLPRPRIRGDRRLPGIVPATKER
jgi:Helix-turn-helix domain